MRKQTLSAGFSLTVEMTVALAVAGTAFAVDTYTSYGTSTVRGTDGQALLPIAGNHPVSVPADWRPLPAGQVRYSISGRYCPCAIPINW
jgi:hypothetical protein